MSSVAALHRKRLRKTKAQLVNELAEMDERLALSTASSADDKDAGGEIERQKIYFESVFQDVADAVVLTDPKRRIVMCNPALSQMFGYDSKEILGRKTEVLYAHPKDFKEQGRVRFNPKTEALLKPYRMDYRRKDGEPFLGETVGAPVRDNEGQMLGYVGIIRDISERTEAEKEEARIRLAIENLAEGLAFFDADDRLIFCNEEYRRVQPLIRDLLKPGVRFEDLVRAHAERGAIPEAKGRVKAYVRERMKLHRHPKEPIIRELADGIWFIIKEGRTPDGGTYAITTYITQLKKVEAELHRSQEQLVGAVAALQEGFALYDADDRLIISNDEYRRLHPKMEDILKPGMRFEDLVRTSIERGLNADAIGYEEKHIRERMELHHHPKGTILRTLTDGTKFLIKESRTPDGGVVITETDVTERVRAEEDVRRLAVAIEGLYENFALYGADDRLIVCNERYRRLNRRIAKATTPGTSFEEHLRAMVEKGLVPEAGGREEEWIEERLERHRNPKGPFELLRQDGIWLLVHDQRMADGSTATISADISERKRAEEALRVSEQNYRALFENAAVGIGRSRITDGKVLLANRKLAQIFGYERVEQFVAEFSFVDHYADSSERERLIALYKEGSDSTVEVSFTTRDGSVVTVANQGWVDEKTGHIDFVMTDITERKRARKASERLSQTIENVPVGIALFDSDDRLVFFNSRYLELMEVMADVIKPGVAFEEMVRAIVTRQPVRDARGREEEYIQERMERHRNPTGPLDLRRDDKWLQANETRMPDGSTFVIITDITEQKQAEEALRDSEARLRGAIESLQEGFALFDADDKLVALNDKYRDVNPAAQGILERGGTFEDVIRANIERGALVEAIGREEAFIKDRLRKHRNPKGPIIRRISDGHWYMLQEVKTPEGGTALSFIDITDLKKTEEALIKSEERLRGAIDSMQEGFVLFDAEDRLVMVNDVYRQINPAAQEFLERGMRYKDLMRANVKSGRIVEAIGREKAFLRERMEQHRDPKGPIIRNFIDGKCYILKETRTPEGGIALTFTDITELKRAESALRESEERFRDVAESAGDWIWEMGPDLRFTFLSPRFYDLFPVEPGKIIGKTRHEFAGVSGDDERWRRHLKDIADHKPFRDFEYAVTVPSGHTRYIRISGKPVFGGDGTFRGYRGTGTDVTVAVEAEAAAAKAQALLFDAVESITVGFALFDRDDRLVLCNTRYRNLHPALAELAVPGISFQGLIEGVAKAGVYHDSMGPLETFLEKRMAYHRNTPSSHEQQYADGRWLEINEYSTQEGGTVLIWTDITERRQAEFALQESEALLKSIFENVPVGLLIKDPDHIVERANDTYLSWYGFNADTIVGFRSDEIEDFQSAEEAEFMNAQEQEVLTTGLTQTRQMDRPFAEGQIHTIAITKFPVYDQQGKITKVGSVSVDLTEQVQAQRALADSEMRFRNVIDNSPMFISLKDKDGRYMLVNQEHTDLFGFGPQDIIGKLISEVLDKKAAKNATAQHQKVIETKAIVVEERPVITKKGNFDFLVTKFPILDESGAVKEIGAIGVNITKRKMLERQLAGSQRMEALGKLTGGVAHDFNNLLTVILGNLQLLERRIPDQKKLKRYFELASGAAQRGAELTTRLLAFARPQKFDVTVFDTNDLIVEMDTLIRGTLGETISLETRFSDGLWPLKADPTQLENALLNLVINAKDAMAEGGKFTIETANVKVDNIVAGQNLDAVPGDYIMIAVGDTGCGMPPEVADHAFEPFFTTKEIGKGTGLGLSLVYGFVKQSDGYVKIYSEPGHGTVVKMYLPRFRTGDELLIDKGTPEGEPVGGNETILVVEDDPDVRQTTVELLEELGYQVIEAEDGPSALRVLDKHSEIDLLFTDVVMPGGMKGPELACEVRNRRPGTKVLYMSGYTEYGAFHDDMVEAEGMLLSKPFEKGELADKLRLTLDS